MQLENKIVIHWSNGLCMLMFENSLTRSNQLNCFALGATLLTSAECSRYF